MSYVTPPHEGRATNCIFPFNIFVHKPFKYRIIVRMVHTFSGDMCRRIEQMPKGSDRRRMCSLTCLPLCLHHYHPSNSQRIKIRIYFSKTPYEKKDQVVCAHLTVCNVRERSERLPIGSSPYVLVINPTVVEESQKLEQFQTKLV